MIIVVRMCWCVLACVGVWLLFVGGCCGVVVATLLLSGGLSSVQN